MSAGGCFFMDRSVFSHWVWERGGKEWTWLIGHAVFRDTTTMFSGHRIPVGRGQYATTFRKLADEWARSPTWVNGFLHDLENNGMVRLDPIRLLSLRGTRKGTRDGTLITIVNYREYQTFPGNRQPEPNADRSATGDIEERRCKNTTAALVASDRSRQPALDPRVQNLVSDVGNGPASPRAGGQPLVATRKPELDESELGPNQKLFFESLSELKTVEDEEKRGQ